MKQSNRKHMKRKYDALIIRFALLGLFNIALSGPAFADPGEMGMGKSMGTTGDQPITDELVELKGKAARLEAALEKNHQGSSVTKQQTNMGGDKMGMNGMASHNGHEKGMQMKGMHSPDSGNGSGEAGQGMEMKHGGNQGVMETQGK
ncbi:hypothetical protein [Methylobacter sp. BBA5.1]|jgi:hypothetical protein|uniref:hypothetical protein n=1 Tax=Methylobacter sp. BBA5.1 TaxID=1495064 RepID=UPI00126814DE|nr:hypothetical protein [Methylobacter sp. BBA5.1]